MLRLGVIADFVSKPVMTGFLLGLGLTIMIGQAPKLLPAALGILILSTEAVGVARSLATAHHYRVEPNRDLSAMGASNLVAGLTSGFVQSGGGSQTAAADRAGGKTQLATLISAGLRRSAIVLALLAVAGGRIAHKR